MTDNDKLNAAFKELDYEDEAFSELEKQLQRKVAHGVTDGSQHDSIAELEQENRLLRARNDRLTKQDLFNDDLIRRQTERIVDMEDQIRNLTGEE
jgi:hypothetical protein